MSPPSQRAVAALLGATAVWRVLSGVAAVVRWLWLGSILGNGSMSLLLVSVVVGPVVGAVAGDAALRRGFWSWSPSAHRRRIGAIGGLLALPFFATRLLRWLLPGQQASLALHGVVTLLATTVVLLVAFGSRSRGDE